MTSTYHVETFWNGRNVLLEEATDGSGILTIEDAATAANEDIDHHTVWCWHREGDKAGMMEDVTDQVRAILVERFLESFEPGDVPHPLIEGEVQVEERAYRYTREQQRADEAPYGEVA